MERMTIIEKLIYGRQIAIAAYKRYETPVLYALKFLMGLIIFSSINGFFSSLGTSYALRLDKFTVVLLAAILTAIVPPTWVFMLIWAFITLHIFYISLELSVIIGLLLLCLVFFYIRVFPKESCLIILLLICFKLKIPYLVPLFAGLFVGIGSVGALIIGVFIWSLLPKAGIFSIEGSTLSDINVLSLPQSFADSLKAVLEALSSGNGWVQMALVFVISAIAVYVISKLPAPYSMEIGLGVGVFALLAGMIMAIVSGAVEFGILGTVFSIIISAALAYVCKFFYIIVDYSGTERVTFQDDDYLYHVKAVPKVK